MIFTFDFDLTEAGAPVATLFGTARIGPLHGTSTWAITGIVLDTVRGLKASVELTDPSLYARIALHLLTECRADIDAEWADYTRRRRPVEAVVS